MAISKRFCKDCGIDISNLSINSIRCKDCQSEYRYQRSQQFLKELKDEKDYGMPACYKKIGILDL